MNETRIKNELTEYNEFLKKKEKVFVSSGFDVDESELNPMLFDFQKYGVKVGLKKGRFAFFWECGLGKTLSFLEWARIIQQKTNCKIIILCPLNTVEQTIRQGKLINVEVNKYGNGNIQITNFDNIKNVDFSIFNGVIIDESAILKNEIGKTSNLIIDSTKHIKYKLACSATPNPNAALELGMHVEFLGYDTYDNMKSTFFVQDHKIKNSDKWRLKKHAQTEFWKYVCGWSMSIDTPESLGFDSCKFKLPEIKYIEHVIKVKSENGKLFCDSAVSATDIHKDLRKTFQKRIKKVKEIINSDNENYIIWTLHNDESDELNKQIEGSINVKGSDTQDKKAYCSFWFGDETNECNCNKKQQSELYEIDKNIKKYTQGARICPFCGKFERKILISKVSIYGWGANFQNVHNAIFCSYDFKFELFYQAVRRLYRFLQKYIVRINLLVPESQQNVKLSIEKKQKLHQQRIKEMAKYSNLEDYTKDIEIINKNLKPIKHKKYECFHGDSIELIKQIKDNSIDYEFFSPPFKDLFTFSNNPKDISNVGSDKEFYDHFSFIVPELLRVLKPGRLLSMHIMQGTTSIGRDGFYSIVDFRGELIRLFQRHGFYFHAEKMIRKNPQLAAIRTKNHQLLHKSTKTDSSISRPGLADYIITFRKPGKNQVPIKNDIQFEEWTQIAEPYEYDNDINIEVLRQLHEPLWVNIDEGDVLKNFRNGRGKQDEKHLTPTQLTTIKNCYKLWSNEGDTILCPFGGIGSDAFQAIKMNRKPISFELKESYYQVMVQNCKNALIQNSQLSLDL